MTAPIATEMKIAHPAPVRQGLWSMIGNTPLIALHQLFPDIPAGVRILGKAEWTNPGGSVKDRPAAEILEAAIINGEIGNGKVFLDSTSGNMGIAYATLTASIGIPIHLAIPANASESRLAILRALGAELTLTDPLEGSDGAREVAAEIAQSNPDKYYYADQYSNPANWRAHYKTTGPEIWRQTEGEITHLVAGLGTSGTLMGTGKFLREQSRPVHQFAVQPDSPFHGLEGLKHYASSPIPSIYDPVLPDEILPVRTEAAYEMLRHVARNSGYLIGISSGAALSAAHEIARRVKHGSIVVILPDSGLKYLSQPFWNE